MHLHMCINGGMTCRNRESIFTANILDAKRGTTPLLELSRKKNRQVHVHFCFLCKLTLFYAPAHVY